VWTRGAGTDDWATGGNWSGGGIPASTADVLFGSAPSGTGALVVEQNSTDLALNSLWFETGRDYTLGGSGSLALGAGLADGGWLITVLNSDPSVWQSESNIDLDLRLALAPGRTAQIANFSASGLRLGGGLDFGSNHLRIKGGSVVHLAGVLTGAGKLTVATDAGHLILSADNAASWTGDIEVKHGFLVVTETGALGAASGSVVIDGSGSGATLAFRPKLLGTGVNDTSAQTVYVSGQGYGRPWGRINNADQNSPLNLRPIGAIYNDGGDNAFVGNLVLMGDTWFGSRAGSLKLSGAITTSDTVSGGVGLTKVGSGLIELTNADNTWTGATTLREGVLRISAAGALPTGSRIVFEGGLLELGAGDFARDLGTGAGKLSWSGSGGFSAQGAARTVTLAGGAVLTWGTGSFVPTGGALLLSSSYADAAVELTNAIHLGSALREVRVTRGVTLAASGELSGKLSGGPGGGLLKTGDGTLRLSNTANDYEGPTEVREGVLRGAIPSGSNIQLAGGVLGLDSDFTRALGTGGAQLRWLVNRDGGFAAYGVDRTVRLGNNSNTILEFGAANSISNVHYLIFGAPDSDATVIFDNPIRFRGGTLNKGVSRGPGNNIRVIAGTDLSRSVVVFNRPFGVTDNQWGRDLHFWGDGRADIIRDNPNTATGFRSNFVGSRGTDLRLSGDGSLLGITGNYPIEAWWGGSITFDNYGTWSSDTGGKYVAQRIRSQTSIALYAGVFRYWGQASGHSDSEARHLNLHEGANALEILHKAGVNRYTRLSLQHLQHLKGDLDDDGNGTVGNYFSTINFTSNVGFGTSATVSGAAILRFKNQPGRTINGIMPYATVNGTDWARTTPSGTGANQWYYLSAYTDYTTGDQVSWSGATINASPAANVILGSSDRTINSLRLESGRSVDLAGRTLRLNSGALLATGTETTRITGSGDSLLTTANNRMLYAHVYNTAAVGLEISARLNLNGDADGDALVKTGGGTLLLSGSRSNSITGTTYIHQGTLALGKTGGATAIGGHIIVGDEAGRDTLRLDRSEQIANNATVTLRGGHPDPALHLGAEGILQFNGAGGVGLRETFAKLTVEGTGVLDFRGGSAGSANFLIINDLDISGFENYYRASRLFIRNWYEGEDFLLVRRTSANLLNSLSRVEFEGYGPAILRDWDANFYQITAAPEPGTYGAILGTLGLCAYLIRRRHRCGPTRAAPKG